MSSVRSFLLGPWRAVPVLGATQILTWGTLYYTPVLIVPLIAADHGWSFAFAMGGLSLGLVIAGLTAPRVGVLIDRYGGHRVMPAGSCIGAAGLLWLAYAGEPVVYLAAWCVIGVAMAAGLYDPAFATLARLFGGRARTPITALTLIGGFASTVSWPTTHLLLDAIGWRATYLVYAALLALVAAPLHAFALPRGRAEPGPRPAGAVAPTPAALPASGAVFVLVAAAFAAYAFVPSALAAHMLAIFQRAGLDAATIVTIGALFGPAQVAARLAELTFARNLHPLWIARGAIALLVLGFVELAIFGLSVPTTAAFALMFGAANGLITITRGTVPLALFGAAGYGRLIGRIAGPFLFMQAIAPLVVAFIAERLSDAAALAAIAAFATAALACFAAIRQPSAG